MGRDSFDHLESPGRNHRSSRRSPSRRERSPASRHRRSSHSTKSPGREKPSSRTRSPVRANSASRSPSPTTERPRRDRSNHKDEKTSERGLEKNRRSPGREKPSSRTRSPVRANSASRSPSPTTERPRRDRSNHKDEKTSERGLEKNRRSPGREKPSSRTRSPVRANTASRSPSPTTKRPRRDRSNHKDDKTSERGLEKNRRSPVRPNSRSPDSPRTRRLRRAQADKVNERATRKEKKDPENELRDRKSGRHRSLSPPRDEGNHSKEDHRNGNDDDDSVARMKAAAEALETKEKQKPSFELSGKLAAETNRVKGVTLLFTEPPDARKPDIRWRFYVFKGGEALNEPLYVHRQTCYLFGRERRVADIPTDHPSCSKQHAVLQYRQVEKEQPDGMLSKEVRPYIMDLGSTNGTFINDNRIEAERYYELMEKDTIKFGNSSREYVLLHENSAG